MQMESRTARPLARRCRDGALRRMMSSPGQGFRLDSRAKRYIACRLRQQGWRNGTRKSSLGFRAEREATHCQTSKSAIHSQSAFHRSNTLLRRRGTGAFRWGGGPSGRGQKVAISFAAQFYSNGKPCLIKKAHIGEKGNGGVWRLRPPKKPQRLSVLKIGQQLP
jgi:hypothetical protein